MHPCFRFKNHLLLAALASAYPVLGHTAAAARVEFVVGNVSAAGSTGGKRALERGSELNSGETVNTGEGRVQLRFADGGMMSLQPQTEFRIDEYKYDGKIDGKERSFFSLLRGGLRTISGLIGHGNRDNYRVTTSVATIGIRGTEWSGTLNPGASPEDTELNVGTGEGAIEVCNAVGCLTVASGESAVVTGSGAPRRTDVRPNLPPATTTNRPPSTPIYSSAEDRTSSGSLVVVDDNAPKGLPSGSGYSAVTAGYYPLGGSRSYFQGRVFDGAATFDPDPSSNLSKVSDASESHELTGAQAPSALFDDTLAIGKWSTGKSTQSGSTTELSEVLWVVGKTTATDDLSGTTLNNYTGTYAWAGSMATSSLGSASVGTGAKLTAYFAGVSTLLDLDMSVKAGTRTYAVALDSIALTSGTTLFKVEGANVTWTQSGSNGSAYVYVDGMFAGKNASHAGLTFSIYDPVICDCVGSIWDLTQGAVAFRRDGLTATPVMLASGGGYEAAFVGWYDGVSLDGASDVNATFGSNNRLKEASFGLQTYRPSSGATVTDVGALYDGADPVVGWGRWTAGEKEYFGTTSLGAVHYAVGQPMTAGDIAALNGYTGVYEAVGGTKATSSNTSLTGTLQSAKLTVDFGSTGVNNTALDLKVKFNGQTYAFTNQWGFGVGGGKFVSSDSIDYRGFVAKGGKQAGIVYSFDGGANGDISGAAGLNRTSKQVTPSPS